MAQIEAIIVPVAAELLKNVAAAAVNFFRRRLEEPEAKDQARQALGDTTANLTTAVEEIIGAPLGAEGRNALATALEESVSQPPIAEAVARVTIARYSEVPVWQLDALEDWMRQPDLIRTAVKHAWVEDRLSECLKSLGYGIERGRQLHEGVAKFWLDIEARSALPPTHRIVADIVCSPLPNDFQVAALLYDVETSNILQQGDWFFIATHGFFSEFSKATIGAVKDRVSYTISLLEGADLGDLVEAQLDPMRLGPLFQNIVGRP